MGKLGQNLGVSIKTVPKLLSIFHQNWTKTWNFPSKLENASIKINLKNIEKHGKTIENTNKIVKILAGKLLEPAVSQKCEKPPSSSLCAEGSTITSVAGPVQGTGGPVHRPKKPEC